MGKGEARERAIAHLRDVGIPAAERRCRDYPHQLSGGMQQRCMIAIALACDPKLLIADEPTTSLDVTIQAQILTLLSNLVRQKGAGLIFITHDIGVIAQIAERIMVMYAGKIAELGSTAQVIDDPQHPYTVELLKSLPSLSTERGGAAGGDRRRRPGPGRRAVRLPLPPALPARLRALRTGGATSRRDGRRPARRLLAV